MCARHVLYIRTLLRTLQAGIKNTSSLIKNLPRLPEKNLGSFMRVSTVFVLRNFFFNRFEKKKHNYN